ncbi:ABC transporter substrate-binding protein [Brevibacterium litoralis]|uniref:ABC transporter substrate-binding protein n=1 Tax=Brevibacterium litoralis TaxID=3138935 RepID=UPI0032EF76FB
MSTAEATYDITRGVFEGLVALDDAGVPQPQLAESVEVNDDYTEFVFHLREGVTFHDGSALDATDVVDSLTRWQENSPAGAAFAEVTFEATDESTMTLTSPTSFFAALTMLANHQNQYPAITSSEAIASAGAAGMEDIVGTGPYAYVEWQDTQHVQLEKFADYTPYEVDTTGGAAPSVAHYDEIWFDFVPDPSTALSGFQVGDYDVYASPSADQLVQLSEMPDVASATQVRGVSGITINRTADSVFGDKPMRQALAMGLDNEAVLQGAYVDPMFYSADGSLALPGQEDWMTEAGLENYDRVDVDGAKDLIESAGNTGAELTLVTTREYPTLYDMGVVIQQELEGLGFTVSMETYDWATMLDILSNSPDAWDLSPMAWSPQSIPTRYTYMSPNEDGAGEETAYYEAIDAVNHAAGEEEAQAAMADLQEVFWEEVPMAKTGTYNAMMFWDSASVQEITLQTGAGATGLYYLAEPAS